MLHRLPGVETINYHFIGPDLEHSEEEEDQPQVPACDKCTDNNKSITYSLHSYKYGEYQAQHNYLVSYIHRTYSLHSYKYGEYKKQDNYVVPDITLVQNAGFSEFKDTEDVIEWVEGWADLPSLVPAPESLMIFTSYTGGEAKKDLERVEKYCDINVLVSEENPMRSLRPCRDWERDLNKDVFYSNQYYAVLECSKN